jgi:hemolysin III
MTSTTAAVKPRWRGVLHEFAAWYALGAGSVLVAMATSKRAAAAAAVYAVCLVALFTISAIYHRVQWTREEARAWMRRADHASIFLLIAGTYTPVALLGVGNAAGMKMLISVWIGAAAGVALSLFWVRRPKPLVGSLAVLVGWTAVPFFDEVRSMLAPHFWLILAGGLAYTAGAIIYALRRPNPLPAVFGYHEVFHALTLVGASLHFAVVVHMVRTAPPMA